MKQLSVPRWPGGTAGTLTDAAKRGLLDLGDRRDEELARVLIQILGRKTKNSQC